ncbi:unnamed protein product [Mycena citricolor]|uniref:Fungal-type protein kinase domain-containing protein n=1 Tax=Mycena citricolor TaxID=2018698 RepID=A0AAD2K557_9AGAR|nr:unnamed protein product [Mycena citricolor]
MSEPAPQQSDRTQSGTGQSTSHSPRKPRLSAARHGATDLQSRKQKDDNTFDHWVQMSEDHFRGVISTESMLDSMPKPSLETPKFIRTMVELGQPSLDEAWKSREALSAHNAALDPTPREHADKRKPRRRNEQTLLDEMTEYFSAIVQAFPDKHKPEFRDTHMRLIPNADDPADHDTAPDLIALRPRDLSKAPLVPASEVPLIWRNIGFVAEFKDSLSFVVKRSASEMQAALDAEQTNDPGEPGHSAAENEEGEEDGQAGDEKDDNDADDNDADDDDADDDADDDEEVAEIEDEIVVEEDIDPQAEEDDDDQGTGGEVDEKEVRKDPMRYRLTRGRKGREAYVQLAKSARNMLLASGGCHIYLLSVVGKAAHIVRYDNSGWTVTPPIHWKEDNTILPRFFLRLYNPPKAPRFGPGRILGDDFTINPLTKAQRKKLKSALARKKSGYASRLAATEGNLTRHSVSMITVQFVDGPAGERQHKLVRCLTFGKPLWVSHGLFGRATKVIRVILECDLKDPDPTIYALKDSWRQGCRRPEVDYYDVLAHYRKQNPHVLAALKIGSVAECHGSLDLSLTLPMKLQAAEKWNGKWDAQSHRTSSIDRLSKEARNILVRYHTRTLLSPIGLRTEKFGCVKDVVQVIYNALTQAWLAHRAGVRHRDVSNGNVLVDEILKTGFLLDYDYAEFTPEGFDAFTELSKDRARNDEHLYQDINKSLKEITGTPPFLALDLAFDKDVTHEHYHDIESFYWLLIWIILRHTTPQFHGHQQNKFAALFGFDSADKKKLWITDYQVVGPPDSPLRSLTLEWVKLVQEQNRVAVPILNNPPTASFAIPSLGEDDESFAPVEEPPVETAKPAVKMDFRAVVTLVGGWLAQKGWDAMPNDRWVKYTPPYTQKLTTVTQNDTRALNAIFTRESISGPTALGSIPQDRGSKRQARDTREGTSSKRRKAQGQDERIGRDAARDVIE